MRHPEGFATLYMVMHELSETALKDINDFEAIERSPSLKKSFHRIDFVYMHMIILTIAKLLSLTKSDKSGLVQLEKISPQEVKKRIQDLRKRNERLIAKISSNRSRIIAHVDISTKRSYTKMGFSEMEVERMLDGLRKSFFQDGDAMQADLVKRWRNLAATSPEEERYSPSDFLNDLPKLRILAKEVQDIARDLNVYFYNLSDPKTKS